MTEPVPPALRGAYPRRASNTVRPLVDGQPAFRRIAEAVEAARASVWVTVAFIERDLALPGASGTFFDLLDRAAARGLDVRALFWREPELDRLLPGASHFGGSEVERAWLAARGARFLARWDHLPRYCHHQKSWLIDAGRPGEIAFVGGINLDHGSMVPPGHPPVGGGVADDLYVNVHDLYLELRGPAATDVHHNFVQRWNEASERDRPDGVWPDAERAGVLRFPAVASAPAGATPAQVTRTVRPGRYRDATPAPGAAPFPIEAGEQSVLEQYLAAIDAAARTIYLESQFLHSLDVLAHLEAALARGVAVAFVVPAAPMPDIRAARGDPRAAAFFANLEVLGRHPHFTLAGLAASCGGGRYEDVYVHAKAALVDDAWVTIGSTNVASRSFHADTELNMSFWDVRAARALRCTLLREHLGADTASLDDRAALALFRDVACANRDRRVRGERLQGLAFALDPARYAA
ncbi:MAG: phosphatidylserine/phosphatidylglycerophosphate/cardiolipin synthase family protein [Deltaproteobacteria bacterium]|nr:MAG: phosphatidylserine/phosphatidylglycerophosphate/cardiolipin synthase family protein [Deltaproteobacteria bacterium]